MAIRFFLVHVEAGEGGHFFIMPLPSHSENILEHRQDIEKVRYS